MTDNNDSTAKDDKGDKDVVAVLGVDKDTEPVKVPSEPKTNKLMDEAKDAPKKEAPKPKVPKKGVYILEEGDSPGSVSKKLYGRGHMAVPLVRANLDVLWDVGDEITLP